MNLKDDARKRALLLHYVGETVHDIYAAEKADSPATYDETKKVLSTYFKPKRNIQMAIFNFRSCKQKPNQSLDDFVTELRKLSKTCEFPNTDAEILSQVIQHYHSSRLRKRALREPNKSLTEILVLGRSLELADQHAAAIEDESINAIEHNKSWKTTTKTNRKYNLPRTKTQQPIARSIRLHRKSAEIVVANTHMTRYAQQKVKFVIIVRNPIISKLSVIS